MKRVGGLWETVVSFANLHEAARRASLGKRKRPDVARFLMNVEGELVSLRRELESGEYRTGPYREFLVRDAKPRLISAAPFRDRVVHHALTQVLEPIFERRFSKDSYACRVGKGTHKALERAKWAAAREVPAHPGVGRPHRRWIGRTGRSHPLFPRRRLVFAGRAAARPAAGESNFAVPG